MKYFLKDDYKYYIKSKKKNFCYYKDGEIPKLYIKSEEEKLLKFLVNQVKTSFFKMANITSQKLFIIIMIF